MIYDDEMDALQMDKFSRLAFLPCGLNSEAGGGRTTSIRIHGRRSLYNSV